MISAWARFYAQARGLAQGSASAGRPGIGMVIVRPGSATRQHPRGCEDQPEVRGGGAAADCGGPRGNRLLACTGWATLSGGTGGSRRQASPYYGRAELAGGDEKVTMTLAAGEKLGPVRFSRPSAREGSVRDQIVHNVQRSKKVDRDVVN
jgi:hypothetical protein